MDMSMNTKIIRDAIHGYMEISNIAIKIIDTPEFQRLRHIKQLGTCYYVFSGASHNRFEHSIGVAYLAKELLTSIKHKQPELNITQEHITTVELAGLCHDLGHGAFSHIFDNQIIPKYSNIKYKEHEERSCVMFKHIIEKYNIKLTEYQIQTIQELINPILKNAKPRFLYNIVNNIDNGIDVDKFDYIKRDTYNIGLNYTFDYDRIFKQIIVIDDKIAYPSKLKYEIYELFHIRYQLHLQIYTHPVVRSIEYMISECLEKANDVLKIAESVDDPEAFIHLTDNVIQIIKFSEHSNLLESQNIIYKIETRNIFKYIGEIILNPSDKSIYNYDVVKTVALSTKSGIDFTQINENDIIVDQIFLGNKNEPLKNVIFYEPSTRKIVQPKKKEISQLLPTNFSETRLRLYSKVKEKNSIINKLFECFKSAYENKNNPIGNRYIV
jgi:HD superfamily phosphohydrolase